MYTKLDPTHRSNFIPPVKVEGNNIIETSEVVDYINPQSVKNARVLRSINTYRLRVAPDALPVVKKIVDANVNVEMWRLPFEESGLEIVESCDGHYGKISCVILSDSDRKMIAEEFEIRGNFMKKSDSAENCARRAALRSAGVNIPPSIPVWYKFDNVPVI